MCAIVKLKYFHYTILKNSNLTGIPYLSGTFQPTRNKQFKISIRKKLVYLIELYEYNEYSFLKFHPQIHQNNPDRYKITTMGLTYGEKRKLLNTCCRIILDEIDKNQKNSQIYSFFGQWYEKDNELERLFAKRFDLYEKQVTTFFSDDNFFHFKQKEINLYCLSTKQNKDFREKVSILLENLTVDNDFVAQFMTEQAKKEYLVYD